MKRMYWKYYLLLEQDVETISEYVEFTENQKMVYSHRLARLLLVIGAEVDVVAKALCASLGSPSADTINKYRNCILKSPYKAISNLQVEDLRHNFGSLAPWKSWGNNKSPAWWRAYNNVKHNRTSNFSDANVGNVFKALASLFALDLLLKAEQDKTKDKVEFGLHEGSILFDTPFPSGQGEPAQITTTYYISYIPVETK